MSRRRARARPAGVGSGPAYPLQIALMADLVNLQAVKEPLTRDDDLYGYVTFTPARIGDSLRLPGPFAP
jgi:hypothetical protein